MGHLLSEIVIGDETTIPLKVEVLDKIVARVTPTFGLVVSLACNDAINPYN